jgi:hypothetical protein
MDTEVQTVQVIPDSISHAMGDLWGTFLRMVPVPQGNVLTQGLALIMLSDEDSTVPNMISEILIDDNTDVPFKKTTIYGLVTNNIIHTLQEMGFIVSEYANIQNLEELNAILAFIFSMEDYEDLIGLGDLLDCTDIPPVHRYVDAMDRYHGGGLDTVAYEELLDDVSEVVLKTLRSNLAGVDVHEAISELLQKRMRANRELFKGTLALLHITQNGGLGSTPDVYVSFFEYELNQLLLNSTPANQLQYCKEIIALHLISDLNNPRIADAVLSYLHPIITDFVVYSQAESIVNELILV